MAMKVSSNVPKPKPKNKFTSGGSKQATQDAQYRALKKNNPKWNPDKEFLPKEYMEKSSTLIDSAMKHSRPKMK